MSRRVSSARAANTRSKSGSASFIDTTIWLYQWLVKPRALGGFRHDSLHRHTTSAHREAMNSCFVRRVPNSVSSSLVDRVTLSPRPLEQFIGGPRIHHPLDLPHALD